LTKTAYRPVGWIPATNPNESPCCRLEQTVFGVRNLPPTGNLINSNGLRSSITQAGATRRHLFDHGGRTAFASGHRFGGGDVLRCGRKTEHDRRPFQQRARRWSRQKSALASFTNAQVALGAGRARTTSAADFFPPGQPRIGRRQNHRAGAWFPCRGGGANGKESIQPSTWITEFSKLFIAERYYSGQRRPSQARSDKYCKNALDHDSRRIIIQLVVLFVRGEVMMIQQE